MFPFDRFKKKKSFRKGDLMLNSHVKTTFTQLYRNNVPPTMNKSI